MPTPVSSRPLTGRMVLVMLLAFFGVVIGVNVTMMKLAIATLPGTEVDSAYSASLGYEKEIVAARAQAARISSAPLTGPPCCRLKRATETAGR